MGRGLGGNRSVSVSGFHHCAQSGQRCISREGNVGRDPAILKQPRLRPALSWRTQTEALAGLVPEGGLAE